MRRGRGHGTATSWAIWRHRSAHRWGSCQASSRVWHRQPLDAGSTSICHVKRARVAERDVSEGAAPPPQEALAALEATALFDAAVGLMENAQKRQMMQ